jgi:N-formylglutamate deformylase
MPTSYTLHPGTSALVISMPHVGTELPAEQQHRYTARALQVEDTDWFLDRLYAFASAMGATVLVPRYSRYWVDLNRSPHNVAMYPGQNNTELCPTRHFTGDGIYLPGQAPSEAEVKQRVLNFWQPYHDELQAQVLRAVAAHGHAVLFDAHSIKGTLPWLFEGTLPHMNLGTVGGSSCAPSLRSALGAVLAGQSEFTHVVDGRFKGGHITRHFGRPQDNVHAVQLEMAWGAYMLEQAPYQWHAARAERVTPLLQSLVQTMLGWRPNP